MAIARVKSWIAAEILTASDLNAEFNNLVNYLNGTSGTYAGTFGASDGLVGTPSFYFTNDTDTGFYRPSANKIGITLGGTALLALDPTFPISVNQTAAASVTGQFGNSNATPGASAIITALFSASAPDNNTAMFFKGYDTGATRIIIYADGDVQNDDNAYGAISKRGLKQDIIKLPSLWDQVKAYPLSQYRMKEDVEKLGDSAPLRRGTVADEMEKSAPHLVKNGEFVVYSHMYLEAVGALQEAMARIEALEVKVGI